MSRKIIGVTVGTTMNPSRFTNGKSAYEIAVANGFKGTEQEWLDSLRPVLNQKQFNSLRPLAGKKILCLGDSLMGEDQVNGVPSYLAEYTGATVYNGGFSASCLASRRTGSVNVCFDLPNLLNAMVSKDWSEQELRADNLKSDQRYSYFPDTVQMLKSLDMSQLDIITFAHGSNDWSNGESTEYVLTSLKESIDKIQSNWSNIRVLVITPIWRYFGTGDSNADNYIGYGEGYTLKEWAKKIEEAAKSKRTSVLNAYENMPLSINNAATYFDAGSKTNLNEAGNKMYAQLICGKLCSMFASPNPDSYEPDGDVADVDLSDYYNKNEIDSSLQSKADLVDGKVPKSQLPDDIGLGGGGLPEWEDIKNKPFGEEKAFEDIVWDGNTEGHLVVSQQVDLDGIPLDISYIKVSDTFMNKESVYGAEYSTYSFGEDVTFLVDDNWIYGETETGSYFIEVGVANVAVANEVLTVPDLGIEFTFPEVGTWVLLGLVEGEVVISFKHLKFPSTIKYLDEKFIPDTIARQSDINKLISALSSAIGSGVLE